MNNYDIIAVTDEIPFVIYEDFVTVQKHGRRRPRIKTDKTFLR